MNGRGAASVLGISIDALTMPELLAELREDLKRGKRQWVATVNNEMLVQADRDRKYHALLASADRRIADSAGVVWAAYHARVGGGYVRAFGQLVRMAINPAGVRGELPGTIPGSDLSVELAGMCEEFGYRMQLVGSGPGVAAAAASELRTRFPKLQVNATEGGRGTAAEDSTIRATIGQADVILVAYGPPKQDLWISRNLSKLSKPVVVVGVGGTLDYLAGGRPVNGGRPASMPPAWIRHRGFEWAWRLVTQPRRLKRIITAVPVFVGRVVRYDADR